MPYAVEKRGERWACVNPETGKVYGEHDTEADAKAQQRALYAKAPPEEEPDAGEHEDADVPRDDSGRWTGAGGAKDLRSHEEAARFHREKAAEHGLHTKRGYAHEEASVQHGRAAQFHRTHQGGHTDDKAREGERMSRIATEATRLARSIDTDRQDGATAHSVRRFDVIERLDGPTLLPNGWLKADATIARTGIQEYRRGDGSMRRELRPEDVVFHSDAMASFAMVPVTDNHPPDGLLTAENTREYQRGHLGETVRRDGDKVRAPVLITDAGLVKDVIAGKRQLSCGYTCDLEEASGEYQGQRYDCIQRNIRGNHVAVVGMARGGPDLRLKLDFADGVAIRGNCDQPPGSPSRITEDHEDRPMLKIKIDGIEVEVANEQGAQLIERALASREEKADEAEKTTKQLRADAAQAATQAKNDADAFRARATVAESKVTELEKVRKDAQDGLPGLIRARVALEEKAKGILGAQAKIDELSDRKIKESVIMKLLPDVKLDGEPDAFVEAVYRGALVSQEKTAASRGIAAARAATGTPPNRQDEGEHLDADEIHRRNTKASEDAWKKPTVGVTA
jgi:hypothetical protein